MAKTNIYKEIGSPGLSEFSGQIRADFLDEMNGSKAYDNFNEMRLNSPVIGALLSAFEMPLRFIDWTFESEQENDPRVEFLEGARKSMSLSWNDHITEALTFLPFGFSAFEIVYKRNEAGQVVWRKFAPRGQDTVFQWLFDDEGGLAGFTQLATPKYVRTDIPIERLVIYRTRVERGNPEGRSILRTAWIPYYYVKNLQQIEAIGMDRGLDGFPVVKLPEGATTSESDSNSDASKAAKIVRNIRNDEQAGLVLPTGWELELFAPGAQSRLPITETIRRHESRMLMSVLAQFILLGQDGTGSYALSADQTDFFTMAVNSVADIIADTFSKYAIPRLLELNGFDPEGIKLSHTPAGDVDLAKITDMLSRLGSFITWTPDDEQWLRKVGGLPEVGPETIEAEREAKEARAQAIAQSPQGQEKQGDEMMKDDKMMTAFAALAPDDKKRRKVERQLEAIVAAHLEKTRKKVLKYAKDLKRV